MKRKIEDNLLKWKKDVNRRPLMIYGNKQVGKTYSVLKFGEEYYKNVVYFNTENNIEIYKIFKRERTIDRIITHLSMLAAETILEEDTLIVFDNLNDAEIVNGIKVFGRNRHNYHIILITSLKENLKRFKGEEFQYRMMTNVDFEEYLIAINRRSTILMPPSRQRHLCSGYRHRTHRRRLQIRLAPVRRWLQTEGPAYSGSR